MEDKGIVLFEKKRMRLAAIPPLIFVVLIWLVFLLDNTLELRLFKCGIYPMRWNGFQGIVLSPFIHVSVSHVFSNSLPLFVLMWCLWLFYTRIAFRSLMLIWILSGFLTWIIGRESWHIGASGLIFGLSSFLFFSGIIRRYVPLIAISLIVVFLYGSNVWNMFPISMQIDRNVSWEGHLSGSISGFLLAILFRNSGPQKPKMHWSEDEELFSFWDEGEEDTK